MLAILRNYFYTCIKTCQISKLGFWLLIFNNKIHLKKIVFNDIKFLLLVVSSRYNMCSFREHFLLLVVSSRYNIRLGNIYIVMTSDFQVGKNIWSHMWMFPHSKTVFSAYYICWLFYGAMVTNSKLWVWVAEESKFSLWFANTSHTS